MLVPAHMLCFATADLTELQLPSNINISFPEGKEKPMHFEITIKPDEGYYR
jgi:ubiquitin-conjugating enzyme E2 M